MADLVRAGEIVAQMDNLWIELLKDAPPEQRALSFNLYQAALSVGVHGCDQVSKELAERAASWRAGREKRSSDETNRFWTAKAVKESRRPKNRVPGDGGESAYEEVARSQKTSPSTAEKRRYRKPKP
jgi:hypothetical protein